MKDLDKWRKPYPSGHRSYFSYIDACENCGEPFLQRQNREKSRKHSWCSKKCAFSSNFYKNHMRNNRKTLFDKENHNQWRGGRDTVWFDTYYKRLEIVDEVRRSKEDHNVLEVKCTYCGRWYKPNVDSVVRRLTSVDTDPCSKRTHGESRLYCSIHCKNTCPIFRMRKYPKGFKRSTSREVQPELRKMVLKRDGYICQRCGEVDIELHCHHIDGLHKNPIESADIDNCVTLCKKCHKYVHREKGCTYQELKCKEVLQ